MTMDAAELFRLATGNDAQGDDARWRSFVMAVQEWHGQTRATAFAEAQIAVASYQPLALEDMAEPYQRAFSATRTGCLKAVLGCADGGRR